MFVLFVYGDRSGTLRLFEALKSRRIRATVINTPRVIAVGCGISVKVEERDYHRALSVAVTLPKKNALSVYRSVNGSVVRIR